MLCMRSCQFDERAAALFFSQRQVDRAMCETENIIQVESFCIEDIVAAFKAAIYVMRVFVSRISRPL